MTNTETFTWTDELAYAFAQNWARDRTEFEFAMEQFKSRIPANSKQKVYEDCTMKNMAENSMGTRMDIIYSAMNEWAKVIGVKAMLKHGFSENVAISTIEQIINEN